MFGKQKGESKVKSVKIYKKSIWTIGVISLLISGGIICLVGYNTGDFFKQDSMKQAQLSLDEIVRLSEKGEALSLTDFKKYPYTDDGSGVYIRRYAIDDVFEFAIGSGGLEEDARIYYMNLYTKTGTEDFIDIRTGDVTAFINKYKRNSTTNNNSTTDTDNNRVVPTDSLERAINQAILAQQNSTRYDLLTESHTILATEAKSPADDSEKIEQITVYAMVLVIGFDITEETFTDEGGSHIPTVMTFDVTEDGTYNLAEYWEPSDGSYYLSDIKDKFPSDIADEAMDTQRYIQTQMQDCYAQVIDYGAIDTDKMISKIIDEISKMTEDDSNWRRQAKQRDLAYFGDYLLDYAKRYVSEGEQTEAKTKIIEEACQVIVN